MNARVPLFALCCLLLSGACAGGDRDAAVLERGRMYTNWFYDGNFSLLWNRFSPEMRQTFPSAEKLAQFAGRTVKGLGTEQGDVREHVRAEESVKVYTRTAAFTGSPERAILQWALSNDGDVTGFFIRPDTGGAP